MPVWNIQPIGQLGNRLATFAHLIAFGIETGCPVYNPGMRTYSAHFEHLSDNFLCRYPKASGLNPLLSLKLEAGIYRLARSFLRKKALSSRLGLFEYISLGIEEEYDLSLKRTAKTGRRSGLRPRLLALDGWMFRDHAALHRHRETVIKFLAYHPDIRLRVDTWLSTVRTDRRPLIGIHIRRGDFQTAFPHLFFEFSHYVALAKHLVTLFHPAKPRFVICSNESVPAALFEGLDVSISQGSLSEDQYALSRCDYLIGPRSTYSSWASFIGNIPVCFLTSSAFPQTVDEFKACDSP